MIGKINEDRDLAISILQPSQKELDRGLALHKESIVFDTYGFSPISAYNGDEIAAAIEAGASERELKDMRGTDAQTRYIENEKEWNVFVEAWKASGVTCVFQNAGEESNTVKVLIKRLARFIYNTDRKPEFLGKAIQSKDIRKAKQKGKHMVCLSGNGVPMALDMVSVQEELRYIQAFYQLGIRMMHLTYNRRNFIGDGCGEKTDGGLSDFGKAVVRELNRVGVLIDVAHSGWQTSLEAANESEKPIVASHTAVAEIHNHIRSKPNKVIRAIADKEGYIGICCIPRFLGGHGDIRDMMRHIDYVVRNFGSDYVGIGTDSVYLSPYFEKEKDKIPSYRLGRTRWEALWSPRQFTETDKMRRSMVWTNWPIFTVGLVQLGYSDEVIRKIIGGNAMRVLDKVQGIE